MMLLPMKLPSERPNLHNCSCDINFLIDTKFCEWKSNQNYCGQNRWKDRWFLVFIKWHLFHFLVGRDSRLLTTDTQWKLILGWQPPQRNNVCTFFIISLYDEEDFFLPKWFLMMAIALQGHHQLQMGCG